MKKLLNTIIVFSLLLTLVSTAFAAIPYDVKGTKYESAVAKLQALGIVSGYANGAFGPEDKITRGQFAKMVAYAAGFSKAAELLGNSYTGFPDVSPSHWAAGYITVATNRGYLNGYADGTFGVNDNVTYAQVSAVLLRLLGYKDEGLIGSWPTNYIIKASELGLLDHVNFRAYTPATRGDVSIMLAYVLEQELVTYSKDSEAFNKTGIDLITNAFSLSFKPAILTAAELDNDNDVSLDGKLEETKSLYIEGDSLTTLLAHNVEYLKVDEKVTYIRDAQDSADVIEGTYVGTDIYEGDLDKNTSFTFKDIDGNYNIKNDGTKVTARLYINNTLVTPNNFSLDKETFVRAYLDDNNDIRAVVVNNYDYSDVVVTDITKGYKTTTFSFSGGSVVADTETTIIGDASSVNEVNIGDVLRVELDPSKVNTAKVIEVNRFMVQGIVTYNNTTTKLVIIHGRVYDYIPSLSFITGEEYKVYFNKYGTIVEAIPVTVTNDDVIFVEIDNYNELVGTRVINVNDLVFINSDGSRYAIRIKDGYSLPSGIEEGDVIKYTISDGVINDVREAEILPGITYNTADSSGAKTIDNDGLNSIYKYISADGSKIYVSNSTIYVDLSQVPSEEPRIVEFKDLAVGNEIKEYTINDNQYIFVYTKDVIVDNPTGVFLGVISKLDENDVIRVVQVLQGNDVIEYYIEDNAFNLLKSGTLITLYDNGAGGLGTANNGEYDNVVEAEEYNQILDSGISQFTVTNNHGTTDTYRVSTNTQFYIVTKDTDNNFTDADITSYGTLRGYTHAPENTVLIQIVPDSNNSDFAGSVVITVFE